MKKRMQVLATLDGTAPNRGSDCADLRCHNYFRSYSWDPTRWPNHGVGREHCATVAVQRSAVLSSSCLSIPKKCVPLMVQLDETGAVP
jgi:hypothetical protein